MSLRVSLLKAENKNEAAQYDGTWRDADPAEVKAKLDAGVPHTYRFKVPKGKVCSSASFLPSMSRSPKRVDVSSLSSIRDTPLNRFVQSFPWIQIIRGLTNCCF